MVNQTKPLPWWARFILYAFAGWCLELFFTTVASLVAGDPKLTGQSYLWMLPVWGLGVLTLEKLSDILNHFDVWLRARIIVFMVAAFVIEYVSGFMISSVAGVVPWDYTQTGWNVDEYIRLDYAPFWALTGIFLEPLIGFVRRIEIRTKTPLGATDSILGYEPGDGSSNLLEGAKKEGDNDEKETVAHHSV